MPLLDWPQRAAGFPWKQSKAPPSQKMSRVCAIASLMRVFDTEGQPHMEALGQPCSPSLESGHQH